MSQSEQTLKDVFDYQDALEAKGVTSPVAAVHGKALLYSLDSVNTRPTRDMLKAVNSVSGDQKPVLLTPQDRRALHAYKNDLVINGVPPEEALVHTKGFEVYMTEFRKNGIRKDKRLPKGVEYGQDFGNEVKAAKNADNAVPTQEFPLMAFTIFNAMSMALVVTVSVVLVKTPVISMIAQGFSKTFGIS